MCAAFEQLIIHNPYPDNKKVERSKNNNYL